MIFCKQCCEDKPDTDFRPWSRLCRKCYNGNRNMKRASDPNYNELSRQYNVQSREKNPERYRIQAREAYWRNREKRCESARIARLKVPLRERAHEVVRLAVDRGDLPPAWSMVCDVCQEAQAADWHHPSYEVENQMNVIAVCSPCHGKQHRAGG